jgi:hypothetical protein
MATTHLRGMAKRGVMAAICQMHVANDEPIKQRRFRRFLCKIADRVGDLLLTLQPS